MNLFVTGYFLSGNNEQNSESGKDKLSHLVSSELLNSLGDRMKVLIKLDNVKLVVRETFAQFNLEEKILSHFVWNCKVSVINFAVLCHSGFATAQYQRSLHYLLIKKGGGIRPFETLATP